MSAALVALALFGCSDDGSSCQRLAIPTATYESRGECNSRIEEALASEAAMRADAPTVYAQCLTPRELASLGSGTIDLAKFNQARFAAR